MDDVAAIMRAYPDVHFRYLISPSKNLPSSYIPIFVRHEDIETSIKFGYQDGKQVLANDVRDKDGEL